MQDKRLTHRLTDYWNHLRGEDQLPRWETFDRVSFSELWRQCCGWKVNTDNEETIVYTYEFVGDSALKIAYEDLTGKQFTSIQTSSNNASPPYLVAELLASHFDNFPPTRILQKIDRVVKRPALVIEEGQVLDTSGKNIRFRSCLLPFGEEGIKVSHMALGLSWKAY